MGVYLLARSAFIGDSTVKGIELPIRPKELARRTSTTITQLLKMPVCRLSKQLFRGALNYLKDVMRDMVDTIKILIPVTDPSHFDGSRFSPITLGQLMNSPGYGKTYLNPSSGYAKMGKYMPRLTMYKRARRFGTPVYELAVEFSGPKLVFGNNFDELAEVDFESLLKALQQSLSELLGQRFFAEQLMNANVAAWHPSKNIVFLDYTSCQTILNTIGKLDVSKTYDFQKTDFRDGHVVHIHANSLDIAFYDKMADLRKACVSDKRTFEKGNLTQLNFLEGLTEYRPMEVFRYEVRLVGRASIKRAFPQLERWTLETLFRTALCQGLLTKHWERLTSSVDLLALDVKEPYELLQNYIEANENITPQTALAAVAGLLIANQTGAVGLRNTLEQRFGKQAWYRLKPLLKTPNAHRFTAFQHIDETLEKFTPVHMSDFLTNIESTVK